MLHCHNETCSSAQAALPLCYVSGTAGQQHSAFAHEQYRRGFLSSSTGRGGGRLFFFFFWHPYLKFGKGKMERRRGAWRVTFRKNYKTPCHKLHLSTHNRSIQTFCWMNPSFCRKKYQTYDESAIFSYHSQLKHFLSSKQQLQHPHNAKALYVICKQQLPSLHKTYSHIRPTVTSSQALILHTHCLLTGHQSGRYKSVHSSSHLLSTFFFPSAAIPSWTGNWITFC